MSNSLRIAVVGLLSLVVVHGALAQPGQGRQGNRGMRGGMANFMYIETTWSAVAFECDVSAQQLSKMRPVFQKATDGRAKAMKTARESRDFAAVQKAMTSAKAAVDAIVKTTLTTKQKAALEAWRAKTKKRLAALEGKQDAMRGLMQGMYLDGAWSTVSFELKVSSATLEKIRPGFNAQWTVREKAMDKADTSAIAKIKPAIDATLKKHLSTKEWAAYQKLLQERQKRMGGGPGGGGGGRQGGGGGGGRQGGGQR